MKAIQKENLELGFYKCSIKNRDERSPVARAFNSAGHGVWSLCFMGIMTVRSLWRGGDRERMWLKQSIAVVMFFMIICIIDVYAFVCSMEVFHMIGRHICIHIFFYCKCVNLAVTYLTVTITIYDIFSKSISHLICCYNHMCNILSRSISHSSGSCNNRMRYIFSY